MVDELTATVCRQRRLDATSNGVEVDVEARAVDIIILVVERRREVGRRTFTGAVDGGGNGVKTSSTELTRQRTTN